MSDTTLNENDEEDEILTIIRLIELEFANSKDPTNPDIEDDEKSDNKHED